MSVGSVGYAQSDAPVRATRTPLPVRATQTPLPTQAPTAMPTQRPTYTPYPTYTPMPTYTPVPTDQPTMTPYPTYTPFPTQEVEATATTEIVSLNPPTNTPVPTSTPQWSATQDAQRRAWQQSATATAQSNTPYPTKTPYPTETPQWEQTRAAMATATPYPTATPRPTSTPQWSATQEARRLIWERSATATAVAAQASASTSSGYSPRSFVMNEPSREVTFDQPGIVRVEVYIDSDQDGRLDPSEGISGLYIEAETIDQTWRGEGRSTNGVIIFNVPYGEDLNISIPYLQESQASKASESIDGFVSFALLPPLLPIELP